MRSRKLWLMSAVTVAGIILVGMALAEPADNKDKPTTDKKDGQPPKVDDRGGPGRRFPPGGGFQGGRGPGGGVERTVDDLKLSGKKKETADAAVKAYQENLRKLADLARADLLLKMKDVLSEADFKTFKDALERQPSAPPGGGGGRGLSAEDTVERIMSFDKNKDGKITKDELPERMQDLIAKGDTNKDGALDKDEIKKLAADLSRDGGFGRGGFGPGGPPGGRPEPGTVLPPPVRDQLKLTDKQEKELAELEKDVKAKLMKILTDDQKKKLEETRDRGPGGPPRGPGRGDRQPPRPDRSK